MKDSFLIVGPSGVASFVSNTLSRKFSTETIEAKDGRLDPTAATLTLGSNPRIGGIFVFSPAGTALCDGMLDFLGRARRLGKPTTVIPGCENTRDQIRVQAESSGARFFNGNLNDETIFSLAVKNN